MLLVSSFDVTKDPFPDFECLHEDRISFCCVYLKAVRTLVGSNAWILNARTLGSWCRIPLEAWLSAFFSMLCCRMSVEAFRRQMSRIKRLQELIMS
jgi:hypothetical protein